MAPISTYPVKTPGRKPLSRRPSTNGGGHWSKVIDFAKAPEIFRSLREQGKSIVQCHGTFDLLHPGHLFHLEEAKALGDVLVVTITAEKYVNKGPGRPFFNDLLRVKSLAALECVDYVVIVPYSAAVEIIECVRPQIYCKGREYREIANDVTGDFVDDVKTVERLGGQVRYIGSVVFSSTRLLNSHFGTHGEEIRDYCRRLARDFPPRRFRDTVESFKDLKVLVIGDIIFDRYTTVSVQGLTSKNRMLSSRFVGDEMQAGGALAVFRHLKEFTSNVKLLGLVGQEPWVEQRLRRYLEPDNDEILRVPEFTTIVKQRFVEPLREGKELSKLFSVNYIDAQHPDGGLQKKIRERLLSQIEDYDLVLVMDFGHGLMQDSIRELVQEKASYLALNCQTNSNNYGFNIIDRQYHRADSFSIDKTEITLACGRRQLDYPAELEHLKDSLGAQYAWLTRGEVETIGLKTGKAPCRCLPFENTVVDTIGAGDAFCALASLAAAKQVPLKLATFMSQLAGAQAVQTVGNSKPIEKNKLLKGGIAMLTY